MDRKYNEIYFYKNYNINCLIIKENLMTKYILFITIIIALLGGLIYFLTTVDSLLLELFPWLLIVSTLIGIVLGLFRARDKDKPLIENGYITRHCLEDFVQHWVTAMGIILLIISGIVLGFLFFPHFADTPNSVILPLNIHFIGLVITAFGGFYFLTGHVFSNKLHNLVPSINDIVNGTLAKYIMRKNISKEHKYLSSQKSAFLIFAVLGGGQLITGIVKITAHFVTIPPLTLAITTLIHDIFSLLFIIMLLVHILFAVLFPSHRILLKSWFTGKISEKYIRERHIAWYDELKKMENGNDIP